MKIVKPKVKLLLEDWNNLSNNEHIANCATIVYGNKKSNNPIQLCNTLIDSKHYSVFRHQSYYYLIPYSDKKSIHYIKKFKNSPYLFISYNDDNGFCCISTNGQFILENKEFAYCFDIYRVTPQQFYEKGDKELMRFSFLCTTQISTSRELNRVSPNNIIEESTRCCNYNKDKFDNQVTICQPHWFNIEELNNETEIYCTKIINPNYNGYSIELAVKNDLYIPITDVNININPKYSIYNVIDYLSSMINSCNNYINLVNNLYAQDARGILPLDTATNVIYTYTIKEWRHILDLRYYGKTGTPHPNAKYLCGLIKEKLEKYNYKFE